MSVNKNIIWFYLSLLPVIVAAASIILLMLISILELIEDHKLFIIIAFAFAEFTMVLAGMGGIAYLIDDMRTPASLRLMKLNIVLFFLAALAGLILFMTL